jgi:hypothetical protein
MALWPQLTRLSLMAGTLEYLGAVYTLRMQSCYQHGDLAFLTPLALQCCPIPTAIPTRGITQALLCQHGWDICCKTFTLSLTLKQLGELALPPLEKADNSLLLLPVSLRVRQALKHIINYLLEEQRHPPGE